MRPKRVTRWTLAAGLLTLCLAVSAAPSAAATRAKKPPQRVEVSGTVSRVVDGDTLWLATEGASEPRVVRIEGIDAPESCQVGGKEATEALTALALNRSVTVRVYAHDDFGRTVGRVYDGALDIGDRMVRDGQAWSMRYRYDRGPYVSEERMAKALQRGLHAAGNALMPRDFRRQHGPCEGVAPKPVSTAPAPGVLFVAGAPARCDGRRYCSQMTSCAEATWFVQHCPDTQMDGDRDGVPCERQWCVR